MLEMGTTVMKDRFKEVSMPCPEKQMAYEEIKDFWKDVEGVTTYQDNGEWYVVIPN